jgi:hypothetical protein
METRVKFDSRHTCLQCGKKIEVGRTDKKFCCNACKNKYHNEKTHYSRSVRLRILGILNRNYEVLDKLLKMDKQSISLGDLSQLGYNKEFVTSWHKVGCHNEYRCFDIKYCCSGSRIFRIERVNPGG